MTLSSADFELLLQANRILSSKLDVDEVLNVVMELATKIVRAEASSLLLLDEKTNELFFNVALGAVGERVKEIRIKIGEGIAGWVAKERKPIVVNDVTQDARFTQKVDHSTQFHTKSVLAVPLLAKGILIGVIEAINKEQGGQFGAQDLEVFEMFASQAAIALENARLFSDVRREKDKLDTVFSEMAEGVLAISDDGRVAFLNPAASAILGIKAGDIIGKIFAPDLFPLFAITPHFDKPSEFTNKTSTLQFFRTEGKELFLDVQIHRFGQGIEKEHDGWLVIFVDKTEERREEKIKRNFLSLISHKLRTPLTVILGYAPLIEGAIADSSNMEAKAIRTIVTQAEQLSNLVDKLLHFAMVESDSVKSKLEPKPLKDLIAEAIRQLKTFIDSQRTSTVFEGTGLDTQVRVDAALATEVIKNLIENAVKFNQGDKRRLTIRVEIKNGFGWVHVKDNGRGIPSEEHQKIFQKFHQIENYFTGQVPGAGLGLAFCKKVVEAMGGEIVLESELNKGTTVSVSFPVAG